MKTSLNNWRGLYSWNQGWGHLWCHKRGLYSWGYNTKLYRGGDNFPLKVYSNTYNHFRRGHPRLIPNQRSNGSPHFHNRVALAIISSRTVSSGKESSSILMGSFSIFTLVLAPLKSRDENILFDADKLYSANLVEVSHSPSTINPSQNQSQKLIFRLTKTRDKEVAYFITKHGNALWTSYRHHTQLRSRQHSTCFFLIWA